MLDKLSSFIDETRSRLIKLEDDVASLKDNPTSKIVEVKIVVKRHGDYIVYSKVHEVPLDDYEHVYCEVATDFCCGSGITICKGRKHFVGCCKVIEIISFIDYLPEINSFMVSVDDSVLLNFNRISRG